MTGRTYTLAWSPPTKEAETTTCTCGEKVTLPAGSKEGFGTVDFVDGYSVCTLVVDERLLHECAPGTGIRQFTLEDALSQLREEPA